MCQYIHSWKGSYAGLNSNQNLSTIDVSTNKFTDMNIINMLQNLDFSPHVRLERQKKMKHLLMELWYAFGQGRTDSIWELGIEVIPLTMGSQK
jgi:hypothetical protein